MTTKPPETREPPVPAPDADGERRAGDPGAMRAYLRNLREVPRSFRESVVRHPRTTSDRARSEALNRNFFLHVFPTRISRHSLRFSTTLGLGIITLVLYLLACWLHPEGFERSGMVITNALFIAFSAAAAAVCTWFNERARLRLFALQREVRTKNETLQSINQTLVEVKGQLVHR